MKKTLLMVLSGFMLINTAIADDFLTEDEIITLFTNNSFDIYNEVKGKERKGFDNDKGEHFIHNPKKNKTYRVRKWWTEGATHCTSHRKRGDNCKKMKKMGGGVYHGITDGEHTHTLSNFRPGRDF